MAIFIAVILVMTIMVGFMVVAITKVKEQVNSQIGKDVERLLNIYDSLFEKKSQQLADIEMKIEEKSMELYQSNEEEMTYEVMPLGTVIIDQGQYINPYFFKDYTFIKNNFHDLSYIAMKETVEKLVKVKRDINVHEFKELLNIFDYELQYQMSTLPQQDQLEVIHMVAHHSLGKRRILQKYIEQADEFDFRDFMDYVRDYIFNHDTVIYVLSYSGKPCLENMPKNVIYLKDESIGEGYIVKFRNSIYDYSL